jgi:hypothetical protein
MARGVVRDRERERRPLTWPALRQHLGDIADAARDGERAITPRRVVGEQVTVLLHHRPTAGRVRHDDVGAAASERADIASGERPRPVEVAGVGMQRAAASLAGRAREREPVCRQHAFGGPVRVSEQSFHHAPAEHGDALACGAPVRRVAGRRDGRPGALEHREGEAGAPRQAGEQSRESRRSDEPRDAEDHRAKPVVGHHCEHESGDRRDRPAHGDGRARRLEQGAVRHAARARGLAAPTSEAAVDMGVKILVGLGQFSFDHGAHEEQPSAGTVVLVSRGDVRRARLQAKAAMHAEVETGRGSRQRSPAAQFRGQRSRVGAHDDSPRMRGFRRRSGSKA